ncbi:uncharacterized protein PV09_09674 [Verruconis gallopava]|uniref:Amino acid permease/ SLC12A domain-containing protein n=1 Tax=Verruconis gallopava TaxID=253628 RepID=A0A0D1ZVR3_9PEZI|nr:uncharacterized protein PV09_09674 [Verruconis gallopava]KIV98522.1 hypothetical protein PV09_09674 [Verruconis gallopava]
MRHHSYEFRKTWVQPRGRPQSFMSGHSDTSIDNRTELRAELKERHVNMMAFSYCLGVGLFLGCGRVIFLAGPGLAVVMYILVGTVMWSTVASLGEMTAVFPVKGALFEFPRRFLDQSIGFAIAWLVWFSWVIVIAAELLAITSIFRFDIANDYLRDRHYPEPSVTWQFGNDTSPAVWVSIFLVLIGLVNLLPVQWYGRIEYVFGCAKMIFITGLILFNVILNARNHSQQRFWTYNAPYSFASKNMTVRVDGSGKALLEIDGSLGTFAGTWSAMTAIIFSMMSFELVAVAAAENRDLKETETVKIASRKIALRVILLYALACFVVGLNVPYTDSQVRDMAISSIGGGQGSIFIIAAIRGRVKTWPHIFNGFFIFSALSAGINALYSSSRALHALASLHEAWPRWGPVESLRSRLESTSHGVPYCAVFVSWLFGLLAFLSTKTTPATALGRIGTNSTISMMIVYATNNAAFLQFYRSMNAAARGDDENVGKDVEKTRSYRRKGSQYPYRSHGQWLRAAYGLLGTSLFVIFNGWRVFMPPFQVADFVASYISIVIFALLTCMYYVKLNGLAPAGWRRTAPKMAGLVPVQVQDERSRPACDFCGVPHRKGKLRIPDRGLTLKNVKCFLEWAWTWIK